MIAEVIEKMKEKYRIKKYRENYILSMVDDASPEVVAMLEKESMQRMESLTDVCIVWNLLNAARKKAEKDFEDTKIVGVVAVVLENAATAGIYSVELAKRIAASLFGVNITRYELDMIETRTRSKMP